MQIKDNVEHDKKLLAVFHSLREYGITLRKKDGNWDRRRWSGLGIYFIRAGLPPTQTNYTPLKAGPLLKTSQPSSRSYR